MNNKSTNLDRMIVILFFLSGFTALIYQVIWVRLLTKYVGGSSFSISIVLTLFMGGLTLGSIIASRLVDRVRQTGSLVLIYGAIEAAIGLFGILIPVIIPWLKPVYSALYNNLYERFLIYNVISSLFTVVLLLAPTTLMGATLPVLSKYYLRTFPGMGSRMGRLYGVNTFAAALGALLSGLWMIYSFGITGTLAIAVTVNFAIGLICVMMVAKSIDWRQAFSLATRESSSANANVSKGILAILAVSGFCGMGYEVTWTRLIALLVGPTTYSFSIVLFTFITGLALGSMLFGKLCDKTRHPFLLLATTQLAGCLLAMLTSHFLGSSQFFFADILYKFKNNFILLESVKALALFAFMLPPTIFFGAAFPIATKVHTKNLDTVGKSVGSLFASNTIGALLGSFITGFIMIPFIGKAGSISLLVIAQTLAIVIVVAIYRRSTKSDNTLRPDDIYAGNKFSMAATIAGVIILLLSLRLPRWDTASLAQAKYHRFDRIKPALECVSPLTALLSPERINQIIPPDDETIIYINDGIGGFIAVGESVNELGRTNLFLSISGKTDASTGHDMSTMTLSGQIPMLLHPDPKKALVVGLASGITAGEMLLYPIDQLDVLEISPEVVEACGYFEKWNNNVLSEPRAKIITQDARTHMALSSEKYDVIMSEPSNPWMAGVASLFTLEYFQDVKSRLNKNGVFVQWFQTYQTDRETFDMMAGTLCKVFPNTVLLRSETEGADFLFVCFNNEDAEFEIDTAREKMKYAKHSTNMRMSTPELLLPLLISSNPGTVITTKRFHTENHPYLEYLAPRRLYGGSENIVEYMSAKGELSAKIKNKLASFNRTSLRIDFADFMASMNVMPFNLVNAPNLTKEQTIRLNNIHAGYASRNMLNDYNKIIDPEYRRLCLDIHKSILEQKQQKLALYSPSSAHVYARTCFALGDVYRGYGDYKSAGKMYHKAAQVMPGFRLALQNLAASHERTGDYAMANEILDKLLEQTPRSHRILTKKAANLLNINRKEAALETIEKALEINPRYVPALVAASGLHGMLENYEKSVEYGYRALENDPRKLKAYHNLIAALARMNQLSRIAEVAHQGLKWFPQDQLLKNAYDQTYTYLSR